jgi:predicted nucleic acid-binding protein
VIGVIDASLTLSWIFQDERTIAGMKLLDEISQDGAIVPALWRLEIANALQMAVKRGRISVALRDHALRRFEQLPIEVDSETDGQAWRGTLQLSDHHRLTLYDAAYLELALRRGLPIATRGQDLENAAQVAGVIVLPTS